MRMLRIFLTILSVPLAPVEGSSHFFCDVGLLMMYVQMVCVCSLIIFYLCSYILYYEMRLNTLMYDNKEQINSTYTLAGEKIILQWNALFDITL